jgi:YidC/Oxa1 family membrane protein insertase
MNEQQRIFLTVFLCLSIWSTWQYFGAKPEAPEQASVATAPSAVEAPRAASAPQQAPASLAPANGPHAGVSVLPKPPMPVHRAFRTPLVAGSMRNGDAGLVALDLLQFDERNRQEAESGAPKEPVSMVIPADKQPVGLDAVQAAIVWDLDQALPPAMDFTGPQELILAGTAGNGLQAQIEAVPRSDAYAIDYVLRITNPTDQSHRAGASLDLALTPWSEESTGYFAPPQDPLHGLCNVNGSLERRTLKDLTKGPYASPAQASWAALDRQYFLLAVMPLNGTQGACAMRSQGNTLSLRYTFEGQVLAPRQVWEQRFSLYAGPKRDIELGQVSGELKRSIDFTLLKVPLDFLGRPMVYALFFFKLTHSWGVAIMLLTLSIKLLLFPVSFKSMLSMRKAAGLAPELQAIKAKYAHDKERQQMETLKLYRDRNVNPVGGCLPMLLQMPVWLTLYKTLGSAVDLYQQPFLWMPDLSSPERLPILAVTVGLITLLQQRMTPMAVDNQQAKVMMYVVPAMFTAFMVYVPSGLVLYIMTNSILTILQQLAINSRATASPQKVPGR